MGRTLEYKPDFERAQRYWDALWNNTVIDRPCTMVTALKTAQPSDYRRLVSVDDDFTSVVRGCHAYFESFAFLGEAMPAFRPGFGPDQMAAFVGAPLVISQGSNQTSWSEKVVTDWESFLPLRIEESNRYFQRMKEFHAIAEDHLEGKCLLAEIDMHANVDLLEGLRGAQNLIYDMIAEPETVLKAMTQARAVYRPVYETFYQYGNKTKWGTTSNLPMYDRGRYNRIQADFIALLSPDLFRQFVLPALEEEAEYLDRSCFHLDGKDALNHLDDILSIDALDAVQWVPGDGAKPQIEWPEVLHKIQDAGKIIILYVTMDDVKRIHGEYDPALLVYDVGAASVDEGLAFLDWLVRNT